ncbi:MAG TPA: TonB-dependent receptor [Arenimonas sp.]|nr:TonB-dependent receptor [Arenimonas sp.]
MPLPATRLYPLTLLLAAGIAAPAAGQELLQLSLEELMQMEIVTASRSAERAIDAPATVIVLTREDLRRRGYRELSEIYNDLPGMDLSRSYGDTFYRNQWRGLRKSIGTPYLLLLDGVVQNHLYFNQEEIIAALPISSIERIEIVYGPASVVYGANAFVGAVNVVSRAPLEDDGQLLVANLGAGSFQRRAADLHYRLRRGDWRLSLAARRMEGDIDAKAAADYEWTRAEYLRDPQLWGGFASDPDWTRVSSPYATRAVDLRIGHGRIELVLQHFSLDAHFGLVYPFDLIHPLSYWPEPEWSALLRHELSLGDRLSGQVMLRYRRSGVAPESTELDSYDSSGTDPITGGPQRVLIGSTWGSDNRSWALHADFEYQRDERWNWQAGAKFEGKDLQRAYRIFWGPEVPVGEADVDDFPFPPPAEFDIIPDNRIDTRDSAVYLLGRFRAGEWWGWGETHSFHAGIRYDRNSEYGLARTLRGGYVLGRAPWTFKLLYGESFNEPAPRELYGGWTGSGSNPTLRPESASTLEASLTWQWSRASLIASVYRLDSADNITTFTGGATNLGDRRIRGADLHLHTRLPIGERDWSLWAYYSYIEARESVPASDGSLYSRDVGDTSPHKLHVGLTWPITERLTATLRARYIAARDTVDTNPLGEVPSYATADLTLVQRDWPRRGIGWTLALTNLGDRRYFHPGLREGNAGVDPGFRDADGVWRGSGGYFNSLLAQEGRGAWLGLSVEF